MDQPVVTLLGDSNTKVPALVANVSSNGIGLVSSSQFPPGTALKIELDDPYILGEAVYCEEEAKGWLVGVELSQVPFGTQPAAARI